MGTVLLHYKVTLKCGHAVNSAFGKVILVLFLLEHFSLGLIAGLLIGAEGKGHWNYQDTRSHLKILSLTLLAV